MLGGRPISETYSEYITGISGNAPDSTIASHATTLKPLVADYAGTTTTEITEDEVAVHLAAEHPDEEVETIRGRLSTLANFIAYAWREHPEIVQLRLREALHNNTECDAKWMEEIGFLPLPDSRRGTIDAYLDYLRNRQYGTRIHAFSELTVATASRLAPLLRVDRGGVDLDQGEVKIDVSEKYLVGSSGLLGHRCPSLPESCCDAIEAYLHHHRKQPSNDQQALFTTNNGRVSRHAIGSAINKTSSRGVLNRFIDDDSPEGLPEIPDNGVWSLSFRTIRRYALAHSIDN